MTVTDCVYCGQLCQVLPSQGAHPPICTDCEAIRRDTIPLSAVQAVIEELKHYHTAQMQEMYHERWGDLSVGRADGARVAIEYLTALLPQEDQPHE